MSRSVLWEHRKHRWPRHVVMHESFLAYYTGKNDAQGYLDYETHGVIAGYNGRERLWTVERFNL